MLKAAGREDQDWFDFESIDQFSCTDLKIVNDLWVDYSDGKFGFSVQLSKYLETGNKLSEYNDETWQQFVDTIGWRVNGKTLSVDETKYDTNAPEGELPLHFHKIGKITLVDYNILSVSFFNISTQCAIGN